MFWKSLSFNYAFFCPLIVFWFFLPSPPPYTSPNHTGWSPDPSSVSPATIVVTTGFTWNRREGVLDMDICSKVSPTSWQKETEGEWLGYLWQNVIKWWPSHVLCLLETKEKRQTIYELKCVERVFKRISPLMGVEQGVVLYFSSKWPTSWGLDRV